MADLTPTVVDTEPGTRGRLVVKDRAISRIAVASALSVPGVIRHSGGLLKLPGRDLPRADVTTGTDSVAVTLYIAVSWPCPVAALAREVHETVAERIETLTGYPLDHLHLVVAGASPLPVPDGDLDAAQLGCDATIVAGREPLARPDAAVAALAAAVALIALGAVAGREFLIERGVIAPAAWLRNTVTWMSDAHWQNWMLPAAVAAAIAGLLLVLLAVAPRTRTHVPAGGPTPVVWLRPTDVARMCSARASTVGGVAAVHTTVTRRRATVHVTSDGEIDAAGLTEQVRDAVTPALDVLASPRTLRVRVK